jgi:hypothetical protein
MIGLTVLCVHLKITMIGLLAEDTDASTIAIPEGSVQRQWRSHHRAPCIRGGVVVGHRTREMSLWGRTVFDPEIGRSRRLTWMRVTGGHRENVRLKCLSVQEQQGVYKRHRFFERDELFVTICQDNPS